MAKKNNTDAALTADEPTVSGDVAPVAAPVAGNIEIELKTIPTNPQLFREFLEGYCGSPIQTIALQLNHYFFSDNKAGFIESVKQIVGNAEAVQVQEFMDKATKFSLRTRSNDGGNAIVVLKFALSGGDAVNGDSRIELEFETDTPMVEADIILENFGVLTESRWSRRREVFATPEGMNICFDTNAGYGVFVEIELVESAEGLSDSQVTARKNAMLAEVKAWAKTNGLEELPKEKLARMYQYYVANWRNYYGTNGVFVI